MNTKKSTDSLEVRIFEPHLIESAIECYLSVWENHNTIFRALNATREEYRSVVTLTCEQAAQDGLGVVLWDTHRASVVGFAFSIDLFDELKVEHNKVVHGTPNMRVWGQFLSGALAHYVDRFHGSGGSSLERGQALYMNVGGLRPELLGRGLLRMMVNLTIHEFAVGRGYTRVLGVATHRNGISSVSKPPMEVVAEIEFASLDDPRLQAITDPPAFVVGTALLNAQARATYARAVETYAECLEPHRRWRPRA